MRRVLAFALVLVAAGPAPLTDARIRELLVRQERAWNAGDLKAYFAVYAPEAVFVDQARSNENTLVPYGRSTLAQARANSARALKRGKMSEQSQVVRVHLAQDGRTATARLTVVSRVGTRTSCAERLQTFALRGPRIVSTGQTDTIVRCRRAG